MAHPPEGIHYSTKVCQPVPPLISCILKNISIQAIKLFSCIRKYTYNDFIPLSV